MSHFIDILIYLFLFFSFSLNIYHSLYIFHLYTAGYLSLWSLLNDEIAAQNIIVELGENPTYSFSGRGEASSKLSPEIPQTVCIGGEWYTFPSHFFLPKNVRLEYVRGTFHGQLPQHFSSFLGTSAIPAQRFNNMNQEEESRYVMLSTCDYLVAAIDRDDENDEDKDEDEDVESGSRGIFNKNMNIEKLPNSVGVTKRNKKKTREEKIFEFKYDTVDGVADISNFRFLFSTRVINPSKSRSAVARAYFIPGLSGTANAFNSYSAFKREL